MGKGRMTATRLLKEAGVTKAELRILAGVMRGLSNKEIAEENFVREDAVKFHCSNLYKRLVVRDRSQLILKMVHAGYFEENPLPELMPNTTAHAYAEQVGRIN